MACGAVDVAALFFWATACLTEDRGRLVLSQTQKGKPFHALLKKPERAYIWAPWDLQSPVVIRTS